MPLHPKALESPIACYGYGTSFHSTFRQKPALIFPVNRAHSLFTCKGLGIDVPKLCSDSLGSVNYAAVPDRKLRSVGIKDVDIATLGNLCVDIVLNVPQLPPPSVDERKTFMERLSESPPDKKYWEAGGNCNVAIAAARLGLGCITIGHVGDEIYGRFLLDVIHEEGIGMSEMSNKTDVVNSFSASCETLLCWVLVDPLQRHAFCSRAAFSQEPAFHWMSTLSTDVKIAIKKSKVLFCNGYGFDELSPGVILSALEYAVEVGTSVFFDPGPRGKSLSNGTPEEKRALNQLLRMSDALLLTSDEAESLTGSRNPILAGKELLQRGNRTKWVVVKMGSMGSILITRSRIACAPAFKVDVIDTVGCGDSFVAAIAYSFIHKLPMVNTLAFANAVGAATAMGCGAGRNVATLDKVKDILKSSDLNEDYEFWMDLLGKNIDTQKITLLTSAVINGNNNQLNLVSFNRVVSELSPQLEFPRVEENVMSS